MFRDNEYRVIPEMPGRGYGSFEDCASAAIQNGFPGFALQNGGACFGSANILSTYADLGMSLACSNGNEPT